MSGIFDIRKGAFDSTEAALLHQAYEIALQGLKSTHKVDRAFTNRLAGSVVKVARSEPDCLRNDGSIDPAKLAQRAILRMLQTSAPTLGNEPEPSRKTSLRDRLGRRAEPVVPAETKATVRAAAESPAKIMLRLFERTPFAKL